MEKVKRVFCDVLKELEVKDDVKLKIVPMKVKIASFSLEKSVLRINKHVAEVLDEEELRYIIIHELIHAKTGDVNHGSTFISELSRYFAHAEVREIEMRIIEKIYHALDIKLK